MGISEPAILPINIIDYSNAVSYWWSLLRKQYSEVFVALGKRSAPGGVPPVPGVPLPQEECPLPQEEFPLPPEDPGGVPPAPGGLRSAPCPRRSAPVPGIPPVPGRVEECPLYQKTLTPCNSGVTEGLTQLTEQISSFGQSAHQFTVSLLVHPPISPLSRLAKNGGIGKRR